MRRAGALAVLAALVLGGCGADSERIEPSGVDQLEIPTPSPDPEDFVDQVDNPFYPLEPGSELTYERSGGGTTTVRVAQEPDEVAGVPVTVVETVVQAAGEAPQEQATDYYAQDRAGNVWWFGREGVWEAGSGAEAGLAVPADPRVGDGWRRAYQEGVVEDRLTVLAFDGTALRLRLDTDLEPGAPVYLEHVRGTGLVSSVGPTGSLELVTDPVQDPSG